MQNLNDSKEQSLNGHGVDQEETPFVSNKNEKPVKNGTGNKVADKNYSNLGSDSNVKKEEEEEKPKRKVSFGDLFKFAKKKDKIIMAFAFLCSFAQGAAMPAFAIIFGDFTNDLSGAGTDITELTIIMVLIGVAVFIVSLAGVLLWSLTSSEQVKRLKLVYYEKLLYQNSSWYDKQKIDALAVEYTNQVTSFQSIFSTKLHILFVQVGMVISGLLIGFIVGWSFALFVLLLSPLIILGMVIFAYFLKKNAVVQSEGYKEAGSVTDQAFTYIKTIKSLNGEEHEIQRYSKAVDKAKDASISFGFKGSLGYGFMMFFALLMYAFAFLIGSRLVSNEWQNHNKGRVYNVGDIISIFFCIIMSSFSLAIIGPMMKEIEEGKRAIASILDMVEENLVEDYGNELVNNSKCTIEFKNVSFAYPSNPEHIVLKNLDFTINSGEKIAIVGPSGSGKSTVIQLLMRYYNPTEGEILLNGINIREYNIKDLRNSIGLVSQQPILFADTIKYNLLLGLDKKESISDEYLLEILKQANAHDFVVNLEKKLDEYVGSMGGQLSGGQKQRIAIARALIRKPALFLFDEATSALDRTNEREIQETIDRVSTNNTSVTVAHRLSTVINSDVIYVLDKGELIEKGSHKELVKIKNGVYKELIENQVDGEEGQDIELEESLHGDDLRLNTEASKKFDEVEEESDKKKKKKKKKAPSVFKYAGKELYYMPVIAFFAILNGGVMPAFGILMAKVLFILGRFGKAGEDESELVKEIDVYVILFAVAALVALIASYFQLSVSNYIGEIYTNRLRKMYFRTLLYKDMEYYDMEENEPGTLSQRLQVKCQVINTLLGTYMGTIIQSIGSFLVGLIIAFIYSWRLTLVTLGLSPLLILGGIADAQMMNTSTEKNEDKSNFLQETLNNMKIVRSLNSEDDFIKKYEGQAEAKRKEMVKKGIVSSLVMAFSQMGLFVVYGLVFYIGYKFIERGYHNLDQMLVSMFAIMFGAYGAGMANQFLGNLAEAKVSADMILTEVETPSKIESDPTNPEQNINGIIDYKPDLQGNIEFKDVSFAYQGRKNWVVRKLNMTIEANKSFAFVGSSGCGKSTLMQLLMRFYDPQQGTILFNGFDIKKVNIQYLRSKFGTVRQEPSLFNGTINYNIKYNDDSISQPQIEEACVQANALDFIKDNEGGFERDVGNRGDKLSGGQKQRVAIARVIARQPIVYLFDEATSALDSKSEEIVQQAIEKISQNKTSITIAHRISTIKNSYKIFMLNKGKVVEEGNYDELIAKKRHFYKLAFS